MDSTPRTGILMQLPLLLHKWKWFRFLQWQTRTTHPVSSKQKQRISSTSFEISLRKYSFM
eukprot:m.104239 g.104239  ORF g.104239 m.104239 type:complete len:60 (-) comp13838_c0_seq6:1127-1306(-)